MKGITKRENTNLVLLLHQTCFFVSWLVQLANFSLYDFLLHVRLLLSNTWGGKGHGCLLVYYNLKQAEAADPPTNARETEMTWVGNNSKGVQAFDFFHPRSFRGA